ncbi:hypothetical protein CEXT_240401 [Caerostris extrusa]|uniref:Uncharacterized protein n=1 Tax=Caerostris extrusa TaxID=172846 RepID=A0AAV4XKD1_CAEEX|nr:hypothetical protein CEXT_240401 [Caerostris extrusa]
MGGSAGKSLQLCNCSPAPALFIGIPIKGNQRSQISTASYSVLLLMALHLEHRFASHLHFCLTRWPLDLPQRFHKASFPDNYCTVIHLGRGQTPWEAHHLILGLSKYELIFSQRFNAHVTRKRHCSLQLELKSPAALPASEAAHTSGLRYSRPCRFDDRKIWMLTSRWGYLVFTDVPGRFCAGASGPNYKMPQHRPIKGITSPELIDVHSEFGTGGKHLACPGSL